MNTGSELAAAVEARINADLQLADTLVQRPRATIEPPRRASSGDATALDALQKLGASLDRKITLHEPLGEGGMGVVHLATQATLGRHVAVKTLRAGAHDPDAATRILREAWVTGALEHPNVVPIYDVGVDANGSPIIVMKRIAGSAWADLIADAEAVKRRFSTTDPLEWNVRILESVCNALHFAHSRAILHRDLKPENVMIGSFGEVYVLDWGIAVSLEPDPSGRLPPLSLATEIAGTPCYMAPEMLLGDPTKLSPRTDVYLLGAMFYEIFAGAPPHEGANVHAMVTSVLLAEPKFPPHFPAHARRICQKAMARDPEERFESAEAMHFALEEYLRQRGSRKLAWEAKQSLHRLESAIVTEPSGEDRALAVFHLLGECRFGYRAALAAWPENESARKGLDAALLAAAEHELGEGNPHSAQTLLREVVAQPSPMVVRVEEAVRSRAEADERLKRIQLDQDPAIGARTRAFIGGIFGVIWTVMPLAGWFCASRGSPPSHAVTILASLTLLLLGLVFALWASETLSKTALNRRVGATLGLHLSAQMLLGAGGWLMGLTDDQEMLMLIFSWCLTETIMAVWVEKWFGAAAVASAAAFLLAALRPAWLYPVMSFDNAIFTVVLVRVWFPRTDVADLLARRNVLRRRAREWLVSARGLAEAEEED